MAQSLYQKYRPKKFSEIVGQSWISAVLQKAIGEGKHTHAYLFTGARGTGKTTTARIVAKALNCTDLKNGEPCNKCSACLAIDENRFLDLIEIDAASNRGIDQIRELKERINFAPSEGKNKVYIIDETHMLTNEAFNALLKTLEEPPDHAVFILATTEPHKLPLTVISRTQRFDFKLANEAELKSKLDHILKNEKIKVEDGVLNLVINAAGGSYRDSETILEKILGSAEIVKDKKISIEEARSILGLADEKAVLDMMKSLIGSDSKSALATLEEVDKKGLSHQQFLRQLLELSRQMIRKSVEGKDFPEVGDYNMKSLLSIIKVLSEAGVQIKTSALPSLTFEVAILDICANDDDTQIKPKEKQSTRTGGEETEEEEELEEQVKEEKKQLESVAKKQEATKPKTDDFEKEIELEKVSEVWDKFLDQLRPQNQRLLGFLSKAEPSEIRGEELVLKVPFKFHKDRIENRESKKVISGVFKGLLNVALIPSCKIVTDMREVDEDDEDFDNSDLVEEIFGDMMEEEKL